MGIVVNTMLRVALLIMGTATTRELSMRRVMYPS